MGRSKSENLSKNSRASLKHFMFQTLMNHSKKRKKEDTVKILLVDDDCDDKLLIEEALKESFSSFELRWVKDGVLAVDYLTKTCNFDLAKLPDLILLDLNMPKMSGHEFLKIVKNDLRLRMVPVVVLTSSKSSSDIERAYQNGANSYIAKCCKFKDIVSEISTIANCWLKTVKKSLVVS